MENQKLTILAKILVKEGKVISCDLIEDLILSAKEAFFQLNKVE